MMLGRVELIERDSSLELSPNFGDGRDQAATI
jgi:hypothetical protein